MKRTLTTILALAATYTLSAQMTWTVNFESTDGIFGHPGAPVGHVGTIEVRLESGETVPYAVLTIAPPFLGSAMFLRDVAQFGNWGQDTLVSGRPYYLPDGYADGLEGRLVGLIPNWWVGGVPGGPITSGEYYHSRFSPAVADDPGPIPEPGTYALIAALGLIGFAGYRRLNRR